MSRSVAGERLSKVLEGRRKINPAAGGYLVDEARYLNICTNDSVLTPSGLGYKFGIKRHAAGSHEFYARQFIEADGAMMILLLDHLNSTPTLSQLYNSTFLELSLISIYEFYLFQEHNLYEKASLRLELDRLRNLGQSGVFTPKTRKHKLLFHVTALLELGFATQLHEVVTSEGRLVLTPLGKTFLTIYSSLEHLEWILADTESAETSIMHLLAFKRAELTELDLLHSYLTFESSYLPLISLKSLHTELVCRYAGIGAYPRLADVKSIVVEMQARYGGLVHIYAVGDESVSSVSIERRFLDSLTP